MKLFQKPNYKDVESKRQYDAKKSIKWWVVLLGRE